MVTGRDCPECPPAPEMDNAGTAPRPDGQRIIVECPHCGYREAVDPDTGPSNGFEW